MKISITDIEEAKTRITNHIIETPLISNYFLNKRLNANVMIKTECLQHVGAFKFRGAINRLLQLTTDERERGVVAFSSGNHAQGIALAANILNIPATIVMPENAPDIKIKRTQAYGATIRFYNTLTDSREDIAKEIAAQHNATIVPSYDDPYVIAGQGTCGLEIVNQSKTLGQNIQVVLAPCGGGGLAAGVSMAIKTNSPDTQVYTVEPQGFDDHRRSFLSGKRESIKQGNHSICDALLAPTPGKLTWQINQQNISGGLVVTDEEAAHAVSFAHNYLKLVVEPGGAVALAALLHKKIDVTGKTVCIILSGGNIDAALLSQCLHQHPNP